MKLFIKLIIISFLTSTFILAADFQIRSTANKESDAAVAYNSANDEYLVVWTEWTSSLLPIMGQRMKGDGTGPIGGPFTILALGAYPSVAYNSQTNEYLITAAAFGVILGQKVSSTGTLVGSSNTYVSTSNSIWPKIVYNTLANNYLLVAGELIDLGNDQANIKIYTMKILPNGQPTGTEHLIREQPHGNFSDGARFSVAYAPITSTETPTGRYLLAIDTPADLTMLDDNGLIVSKVINSYNGNLVDNHVPFQQSKIGIAHNLDVAFGYWEGENVFMIVWGDRSQTVNSQEWTGIWAGIVNATPIEYDANAGVSNTVFPVSRIWAHWATPEAAKSWKPVVAYNKVAGKFMIAWRETPSTDSNNDTKVNHIRANAVDVPYTPPPPNVVLSAVSGNENPRNPAIAASTKNADALVVWEDERNFSTKDIDLYGSLFQTTGAKTLTLTSPNGGEMWAYGTEQQIIWQSTNIGSNDVLIEYSADNGATYNYIDSQTNVDGTNTYTWTVPFNPSTQCIVKISVSGLWDESDAQFTIVDPSITIVEPNGGEKWYVGSTQQIIWNNYYFNKNVKIEYSTDEGSSYSTITSGTANTGSYSWIIPNTPSTQCIVRVTEASGGYPTDVSDAVFTILAAKLTLTSPNGGESWKAGTKQNITWTSQNIPDNDVSIEYSTDNGNSYTFVGVLTNNQPAESFEWTVPNTLSTQCLVRISLNMQGVEIVDISDAPFTILNSSSITVISPNGNETWGIGTTHEIKWTSKDFTDPVRIDFLSTSDPNTSFWFNITANTTNDGSFNWSINDSDFVVKPPLYGKIRIADATKNNPDASEDGKVFDWSDSEFKIAEDTTITLISPNGGENWGAGTKHYIEWKGKNTYAGDAKIEYSDDNGKSYYFVHKSKLSNIYEWTVPSTPSTQCLVRISRIDGNYKEFVDISDSLFTISQFKLLSPIGGENWELGSTHEIKWKSTYFTDSLRIEFIGRGDSGLILIPIANKTANDGSYNWTIGGSSFPDTSEYPLIGKIIIGDHTKMWLDDDSDGKLWDQSDWEFYIVNSLNTSTGNNVIVDLGDKTIITFDNVTGEGSTTLDILPTGTPPPNGFEVFPANTPQYYNIVTTAEFSGNIELRMNYNDSSLTSNEESDLGLFVYDTTLNKWQNITTSVDTDSNFIFGNVSHLSEFAIMLPTIDNTIAPNNLWTKFYSNYLDGWSGKSEAGNEVINTLDGGYAVFGHISFGGANTDLRIIKTDANGDTIWTRNHEGGQYAVVNDGLSGIQLQDSSYIVCGYSNANLQLFHVDANGDPIWETTYLYPGSYRCGASSMTSVKNSTFIITGWTNIYGKGDQLFLSKADTSGNIIWSKDYGGSGNDGGGEIIRLSSGDYITVGSTVSFGAGANDIYLLKINEDGDTLWTRTYGGAAEDWGIDVRETPDHGLLILGATRSFSPNPNYSKAYLIRTNSSGDTLWTKLYKNFNYDDVLNRMTPTLDGGYVLAGNSWDQIWVVKINSLGDTV